MSGPAYSTWRRIHRIASAAVTLIAVIHAALTAVIYDAWSPNAAWFLGTGLGLASIGVMNLAHIGAEPCRQPTAPVVRYINYAFALLGLAAVAAVPEPQAMVLLAALCIQAIASHWTLHGPVDRSKAKDLM